MRKTPLLATATLWVGLLSACATTLKTHQEPGPARSSIEKVLTGVGFGNVQQQEVGSAWHITADREQAFSLTEKRFAIEQAPTLRADPINSNTTTFEERVDPSRFTLSDRSETVRYHVDVTLDKTGPERAVTVAVTSTPIPISNKYREIVWKGDEPQSPHQVEEAVSHALERMLAQP